MGFAVSHSLSLSPPSPPPPPSFFPLTYFWRQQLFLKISLLNLVGCCQMRNSWESCVLFILSYFHVAWWTSICHQCQTDQISKIDHAFYNRILTLNSPCLWALIWSCNPCFIPIFRVSIRWVNIIGYCFPKLGNLVSWYQFRRLAGSYFDKAALI